jgi:hypothetical protein
MRLADQVALQEALGKQQQLNVCPVRLPSEVVDDADRRVHVTEDLPRLARTDPHPAKLSRDRDGIARTPAWSHRT